jgi:hypothetical protein
VPANAVLFFFRGVVRGVDCRGRGAGFLGVVVRADDACFEIFEPSWVGFAGSFAGRVCSRKVRSFLYTLGAQGGRLWRAGRFSLLPSRLHASSQHA